MLCGSKAQARTGSLPEILIYLPDGHDGGHFSWVLMSFQLQGEVPIPDRYTTLEQYFFWLKKKVLEI